MMIHNQITTISIHKIQHIHLTFYGTNRKKRKNTEKEKTIMIPEQLRIHIVIMSIYHFGFNFIVWHVIVWLLSVILHNYRMNVSYGIGI